jgi:catechol 2,3-dioxygenase-like lactoylglutathione lyase family enzyme
MGIDHTAIGVSDTETSLKFYRDLLGMKVVGESLNIGTEQEHLDNVFGARVRVTALRPTLQSPGIEFLEYETPPGGRPKPLDVKANDIVHWQTTLIVDDIEAAEKWLRENNVRIVSDQVRTLPDDKLGFKEGIMALDPDGHAMLIVEK